MSSVAIGRSDVLAARVVLNDGTLERLREQVVKIWAKLKPA